MDRAAYAAAANAAGVAGLASLFLPSLDKAWDSPDADPNMSEKIDAGTAIYVAIALGVGALHSLSVGSALPVIAAGTVAGLVVVTYRRAYTRHLGTEDFVALEVG